jgi:hypothetical protein
MPLIQPVLDGGLLPTPKFSDILSRSWKRVGSALTGSKAPEAALNDSCQRIGALRVIRVETQWALRLRNPNSLKAIRGHSSS